jgi:ubiquinone/menaquinone biosynthesis C-methylase UbiE
MELNNVFSFRNRNLQRWSALNAPRFFDDEQERRTWQSPEAILILIGLKRGFTFVDVGCGYGFFALPAAKLVGVNGKVYGLDANDEAIRKLK